MKNPVSGIASFLLFVLFFALIIIASVFVYSKPHIYTVYSDDAWDDVVPYNVLSENEDYNISLSSHGHTLHSDGILTVRQNVLWHKAMGYNAVFITDHNTISNRDEILELKEEFADKVIVMQGMEWTTNRIHLNFLGIYEWDFERFPIPDEPSDQEIEEAIKEAQGQGAVTVACHYLYTTAKNKPTREQLKEWGIDYFEIVNDDCNINDYYDKEAISFCEDNGLGQITGTDMHYPDRLQADGNVHGWTLLKTDEFSEDAVMEQLRLRNTKIIYSEAGAPSVGNFTHTAAYRWLKPLIMTGEYFRGAYVGGNQVVEWSLIGVTILYILMFFLVFKVFAFIKTLINKKTKGI